MRHGIWGLLILALVAVGWPHDARAVSGCDVSTSAPSPASGSFMGAFSCDTTGSLRVTVDGGSVGATATEDAPTYVEGSSSSLSLDLSGNLRATLGTLLSGEDQSADVIKVEQRGYYTSITTATTTVLKNGPGWFQGCHVLGGTLGNVTIYDNTAASGTVMVAAFTPATSSDLKNINASFTTGLTIVTAAATNLTCVVR